MIIKSLNIQNYKSIKDINIDNPNPFTVFVGPNAAGKSNIFEALEFYTLYSQNASDNIIRLFDEINSYIIPKINGTSKHYFGIEFEDFKSSIHLNVGDDGRAGSRSNSFMNKNSIEEFPDIQRNYCEQKSYIQVFDNFSRIFVGNEKIQKLPFDDEKRLSLACSNLEQVLKRVLLNSNRHEEITEWLELLIPEFSRIEIKTEELSQSNNLLIYEKSIRKPLTKKVISDGTYNIVAILTALYQLDEPQFLCIEEPENGLNPKVVRELVKIFREQCREKGHFIWVNTHSQSLVSELSPKEIILVDKVNGETKIKQIQEMDLRGMKMDEALLTNAIGGGIPW